MSKILMVDDDRTVIAAINVLLEGTGQLRFATSGAEAMRLALRWLPDLILLDIEMPGMSGFEVCRAIKASSVLSDVPIIFLTSHNNIEQETLALELGAVDFISKPPRGPIVAARVSTQLRLRAMVEQLRTDATTDALTGLANRRRFDEVGQREWLRAQRTGSPTALLLVDVDFFKAYNDHYGHPAGDRCLYDVAQELQAGVHRPADLVARYGGEEFGIFLPETDGRGGEVVARQLCQRVEALMLPHATSRAAGHVTISIGASAYDPECSSWVGEALSVSRESGRPRPALAALIAAADSALYRAKREGRRRTAFCRLDESLLSDPRDDASHAR